MGRRALSPAHCSAQTLSRGACIQSCRASPEAHGQLVRADIWLIYAVLTRRTELHASLESKTTNAGIVMSSVRFLHSRLGVNVSTPHLGCGNPVAAVSGSRDAHGLPRCREEHAQSARE
jgi:hypothetical protein